MALTQTYSKSGSNGYTLVLTITETATSIENNTSTLSYTLKLHSGNVNHFVDFGIGASLYMEGERVAYRDRDTAPQMSIGFNSSITLLSGTKTIAHTASGSKNVSLSWSMQMASTSYTPGNMPSSGSYSDTFTCTTIPRATTPTLSSSSVNIGDSVTISVSGRASTSFSHVLTYSIGSASGSIATLNTSTTSYSWTLPASIANQIPNATSGAVTITCTTKNGSTVVGSKNVTLTAKVPNTSTYQPTISNFAATEQNATVTGLNLGASYVVQGKSKVTISGTGSGKNGATIKTVTYSVAGKTVSSRENIPITTSGSVTISMTVKDSRGYSTTSSVTRTSLPYAAPSASTRKFFRANSSGTAQNTGEYLGYQIAAVYSYLNGKNTHTWALHVQQKGSQSWTSVASGNSGSASSPNYNINASGVSSSAVLGADNSYTARLTLTDAFGSTEFKADISTGFTTVDYNDSGKGIAFGKASEIDAFECNMSEELRGQFRIWGDILFDNVEQTGQRVVRFGNAAGSANHHDAAIVGGNPSTETGLGAYDFVNSAWIWQYKTGTQKLSLKDDGQLTLTYTSNNYVSSSSFGYVSAYRRSNVYMIRGNLEVTTAIPTGTNWTQIGSIGNYSAAYTEYLSVAAQNGSGVLAVRIEANGTISIANTSGSAVNGLCRFSSAIVCA